MNDTLKDILKDVDFELGVENLLITPYPTQVYLMYDDDKKSFLLHNRGQWISGVPQDVKDRINQIVTVAAEQYKKERAEFEEESRKREEQIEKQRQETFSQFLQSTEKYVNHREQIRGSSK